MSYQTFNFNAASAKKADGGGRIDITGKYTGRIVKAEFVTSKKGTQGIEFEFVSNVDTHATFTIWTHQSDGNPLYGVDKVNAILACTQTRNLTPTDKTIEKYDYDVKAKTKQLCTVAPELENKPIGLLLQRENYQNDAGEWKYQINFYSCFDAKSELTAAEICEKQTVAKELEILLNRLISTGDATRKPQNNGYQQQQQQNGSYANAGKQQPVNNAELDDDLPF